MADQFDTLAGSREPSTLGGIGLALSGLGAGIQGQLPQFQAGLQARQQRGQKLDLDRKKAFAQDLRGTRQLLDAGDVQGASQLLGNRIELINQLGGDATDSMGLLQSIQSVQTPEELQSISGELGTLENRAVAAGFLSAPKAAEGFTLSPGQERFVGGRKVASVAPLAKDVPTSTEIPAELVIGLDQEIATKGAAAFRAAGGGKDGLKAFNEIVDKGGESQRRAASPQIIKTTFPRASSAELTQLQGVMDAAKTTESGLKEAGKLREEQRRNKKGQAFQEKAIDLMGRILGNDELDDVLGSVEGAIDFRLQDSEAELIADIEEAANILTADNLSLMSGVLSESDIKILQNLAGGGLNRKRSPARFRNDVTQIMDKLSSQRVTTIDEQRGGGDIEAKRARLAELRAKAGR